MKRRIGVIGAPLCDGERERGVDSTPGAPRESILIEGLAVDNDLRDFGDVSLETPRVDVWSGKVRNLKLVVRGCQKIMRKVQRVVREGWFPLVIGGDCSMFPEAAAGVGNVLGRIGALYVDGHINFNTPDTTISGYLSGMSLAAAVGRGPEELIGIGEEFPILEERDVAVVGPRKNNIDPPELANFQRTEMKLVSVDELRQNGIKRALEGAAELPKPTTFTLTWM